MYVNLVLNRSLSRQWGLFCSWTSRADPPARPAVLRKRVEYRRRETLAAHKETSSDIRIWYVKVAHTHTFSDTNVPFFFIPLQHRSTASRWTRACCRGNMVSNSNDVTLEDVAMGSKRILFAHLLHNVSAMISGEFELHHRSVCFVIRGPAAVWGYIKARRRLKDFKKKKRQPWQAQVVWNFLSSQAL